VAEDWTVLKSEIDNKYTGYCKVCLYCTTAFFTQVSAFYGIHSHIRGGHPDRPAPDMHDLHFDHGDALADMFRIVAEEDAGVWYYGYCMMCGFKTGGYITNKDALTSVKAHIRMQHQETASG